MNSAAASASAFVAGVAERIDGHAESHSDAQSDVSNSSAGFGDQKDDERDLLSGFKLTSFEMKEKLKNFVAALKEEGKNAYEIAEMVANEISELKSNLADGEELDLDFETPELDNSPKSENANANERTLEASSKISITQKSKQLSRRLAKKEDDDDEETCEDILTERAEGIKEDMKEKYDEFSNRRFQRTYPITEKMYKGTKENKADWNDNYKNKTNFKDKWRMYYHDALKHYMQCGDFNVYNTEDVGGKLKPKERENKLKCKTKIVLHSSIIKQIEKIPYPDFKNREVVEPEESEDSTKNDNTKANQKKVDCLENEVLEKFDDLKNGIKVNFYAKKISAPKKISASQKNFGV